MAYTNSANMSLSMSSNDAFRTWGTFISDGLANSGLTKGTDPDQIDWTTVTNPVLANRSQGYEFWGFNDALQATAPVWIKLSYGTGIVNTYAGFQWSIGSGYQPVTNGLEACVTGFIARDYNLSNTFMSCGMSTPFVNNTVVSYFSGGPNWFVIAMGVRSPSTQSSVPHMLSMERTVDTNGNPTADGVMITWKSGQNPSLGQMVWNPYIGVVGWSGTEGFGILHPGVGTGTTGSNVAVYPLFHDWGGGPFLNPGYNIFGYLNPDFTVDTPNTFNHYGTSHTYMPLGNSMIYGVGGRSTFNQLALMMRWE